MTSDRIKDKAISQRHVNTAIDYAPVEPLLGEKLARKYVIRELQPADGAYLYERAGRRIRTIANRTWSIAVTVVHVDRPRVPLFSLIASKYDGSKKTLTVHDTHANFEEVDDEVTGLLVHLLFTVAHTYAYLAKADTIKVRDVGDLDLQHLLRCCGYDVSKRDKRLLYGLKKV